jgi:hypothetical protein
MSTPMFLTPDQRDFMHDLILAGYWIVKHHGLCPAAMVACGCLESGFGTSENYAKTNCPFSLQKPPEWDWPKASDGVNKCPTVPLPTGGPKGSSVIAPFCCADADVNNPYEADLADATRLWCEWIEHHRNKGGYHQLLSLKDQPEAFTRSLWLVGFGTKADVQLYVDTLKNHNIVEQCNLLVYGF